MILCAIIFVAVLWFVYDATCNGLISGFVTAFITIACAFFLALMIYCCHYTVKTPNEPEFKTIEQYMTDGDTVYIKYDDKVHEYSRDSKKVVINTTLEPNSIKIEGNSCSHYDWVFWVITPFAGIIDGDEITQISINPVN